MTPVDIPSGRGVSRRSGMVHLFADAVEVSDGTETRLVASWLCGASSVQAVEVPETDALSCPSCRLATQVPIGPSVYRAYGRDDELLYVGSTIQPVTRIRAHMNSTDWWCEVARLTFEEYATEAEVRAAEADAIWHEPGVYNRDGVARSRGRDLLAGITVESVDRTRGKSA